MLIRSFNIIHFDVLNVTVELIVYLKFLIYFLTTILIYSYNIIEHLYIDYLSYISGAVTMYNKLSI